MIGPDRGHYSVGPLYKGQVPLYKEMGMNLFTRSMIIDKLVIERLST